MNRCYVLLLIAFSIRASQSPIEVSAASTPNSPLSEISSESVLCNAAMEVFSKFNPSGSLSIRGHVLQAIEEEKRSPIIDHSQISRNLVRIKSGDFPVDGNVTLDYIHALVIKASQKAMKQQQDDLSAQMEELENRWTKGKATVVAIVGSLITSGLTVLGTYMGKRC